MEAAAATDGERLQYDPDLDTFEAYFTQVGKEISKTTGEPKKNWEKTFDKKKLSTEAFSELIAIYWKFKSIGKDQQLWDLWGDNEPHATLQLSFRDVYDSSAEKAKLDVDKWMDQEGAALLLNLVPAVSDKKKGNNEDKKIAFFTKHAACVFETLFTYLWMSWTNTSGISYEEIFDALNHIGPGFIKELLNLMKNAIGSAIDTASSETKFDQWPKITKQAALPFISRSSEFAILVQDLAWALSEPEGMGGYKETKEDGSVIVQNEDGTEENCVQDLVKAENCRIKLPSGSFMNLYRRKTGGPLVKKTAHSIGLSNVALACVDKDTADALQALMDLTASLPDGFSKSQDELDAVQTKRAEKHKQKKEAAKITVDLVGEEEEENDQEKGAEEHRDSPLNGPASPVPPAPAVAAASADDRERGVEEHRDSPLNGPASPVPPAPAVTAASADDQDEQGRKKRTRATLAAASSPEEKTNKKKKKKKKKETITEHVQPTPPASPGRDDNTWRGPTHCEECGALMEKGNCPRCEV